MKKYKILILIIIAALFALSLYGCSSAAGFKFDKETYYIYMDEDAELIPAVSGAGNYTLISSNPSIVEVLEDGKTVKAVFPDGIVTLTAESDGKTATATVITYPKRVTKAPEVGDNKYTVHFDTFGYGSIESQRVMPNERITRPQAARYQDYEVAAWYKDRELTEEFDFSEKITQNMTLYAKWVLLDEPTFVFETKSDGVYIKGLLYPSLNFENIEIPDTDAAGAKIVGISENAFYKVVSGEKIKIPVKRIVIPESVRVIEKFAFCALSYLEEVIFDGDSKLESIGEEAFSQCDRLKGFELPKGLTSLGQKSFYYCKAFDISELPSGLKILPNEVFKDTKITKIDLTNVERIGDAAFANTKLKTITNTQNVKYIWSTSFSKTDWYAEQEGLAGSGDGFIYLGDILYLYVKKSSNIDVTVKENTRVIASNAFPAGNVTNGIIHFPMDTPPFFNEYAIGNANVILSVPKGALNGYYALTTYRSRIYYKDASLMVGLTVYVNYLDSKYNIIVQKYNGVSTQVDLATLLTNEFGSSVTIKRIKTAAFKDLDQLVSVKLPPRVEIIEASAFNLLKNLEIIRIEGDWGTFKPSAGNITTGSFNIGLAIKTWYIYVPSALKGDYERAWELYKDRLVGY